MPTYTPLLAVTGGSNAQTTLSGTGHYVAAIVGVTPGKTITGITAYCTSSTSGVVDVQLETVSSLTPSGSLVATGTSLLSQSVATNNLYEWTLTNSYAVPSSATTALAAVIRWNSGTSIIRRTADNRGTIWSLPRVVHYTGTTTQYQVLPAIAIKYSDGTYSECYCPNSFTSTTYVDSSNPDEIGNAFTPVVNGVCTGLYCVTRNTAGATAVLRLYDDALTQLTTDSEMGITEASDFSATGTLGVVIKPLATPVYLIAGRRYYVTLRSTGSANMYDYYNTFGSQALCDAFTGVPNTKYCGRQNDTGSFTETASKVSSISPLVNTQYQLLRTCNTGGFCG